MFISSRFDQMLLDGEREVGGGGTEHAAGQTPNKPDEQLLLASLLTKCGSPECVKLSIFITLPKSIKNEEQHDGVAVLLSPFLFPPALSPSFFH